MALSRGPQRPGAPEAPARTTRPKDEGHGFTVLLVPREGHGEVRQLSITVRSLRRAIVGLSVALGLVLALCLVGFYSISRVGSHEDLAAENLFLRGRLEDVESKLTRVDASIRRLMLYDSELRKSVGGAPVRPNGLGPVVQPPASEPAPPEGVEAPVEDPGPTEPEPGGPTGAAELPEYEDELPGSPMDDALALETLTASEWASSITARADDMLRRLALLEPRLSKLAEDVQDFMAVSAAFPSLWPVDGVLTSGFGYRNAPIGHRRKFHSGIDVGAPRGTHVVAAASGTIEAAAWHSGYGRMIVIDHGYGIRTLYGHNTAVFVHEGEWVEQGQLIATVGSTGQSTGPHLHFEVWLDGEPVDPLDYLPN